jgi:large subunit ribosomal protein L25
LELIELNANIRTKTGNGPAKALRRQGLLPAILYGPDKKPVSLAVSMSELEKILKSGSAKQTMLNLMIKNGETTTRSAMIKELQRDPVSRNFLHVDFYEISMDRKIRMKVPVVAKGKAVGVEMGGMLQVIRRELEVLCLPQKMPETIEIDITNLDVGDSVHVEELPLADGVEIPADVNFTVLTILSPKKPEDEEVEGEELEGEAVAEEGAEPVEPAAEEK